METKLVFLIAWIKTLFDRKYTFY